ncbi:MAG: hypothetical protein DJ555_01735 [Desulfurococcaceae archaeon]|nr:MAG: hypothetical protein DJ555_01735 [Desulfurococcaceae archaeon]
MREIASGVGLPTQAPGGDGDTVPSLLGVIFRAWVGPGAVWLDSCPRTYRDKEVSVGGRGSWMQPWIKR